ncbi:TPA: hypothetical protein DEP21_03595 [Patescibacteria group bacterium]|nr:hypothetical protein [Candidatus Gracilibacteria bacterium]
MQPEIIYKPIRHGYARINKEGVLQITIPSRLRGDQKFIDMLVEKGQKLLKRYQARTHIDTVTHDEVLLFGEKIPVSEIAPSIKKLPAILKQTLFDYVTPMLDEYSKKLGIDYRGLKIRKTKSKR